MIPRDEETPHDDLLDAAPFDAEDEVELEPEESLETVDSESVEIEPDVDDVFDGDDEAAEEEVEPEDLTLAVELADDPVRLYLKEIGRVELLGSDQELWLAVRMQAPRRLQVLQAGRAARRKAADQALATQQMLFDDMRTAWKRVQEDARRLRYP